MDFPAMLDIGEVFDLFFPSKTIGRLEDVLIDYLTPELILLKKERFGLLSEEAKKVWNLAKQQPIYMFKQNGKIELEMFKRKAREELGFSISTVNKAVQELVTLANRL